MNRSCFLSATLLALLGVAPSANAAPEVVAFWGFANDYDFVANPFKQDFDADVDATVSGNANLQAYLGVPDQLDNNGGGGFVSYTSATSGLNYGPTRTLKFDDARGGGPNFDIGGVTTFLVDKNDGAGALNDNFSNDAMMYITLDGTGFSNFQIRFDIEGDPANLPSTFDIFYRVGGSAGTWFRDPAQNNIGLAFVDYPTPDPENQYANSGLIPLSSLLNGASSIEIILNDFAEGGNGEVEFDNIEIIGTRIPEPTSALLVVAALATAAGLGSSKR
jgi:hypothetical protein